MDVGSPDIASSRHVDVGSPDIASSRHVDVGSPDIASSRAGGEQETGREANSSATAYREVSVMGDEQVEV